MARRLTGGKLIVASHNPGKVRDICELLAPFGIAVATAAELGLAEPAETGASFVANAEIKGHAASRTGRLPALADDSGLVVPALGGVPGIHSARWAGPERDFDAAMRRLEAELADCEDRRAYFASALALASARRSRAGSTAPSSSPRAASAASATIPSSCPTATTAPLAKWGRRRNATSATGRARCACSAPPASAGAPSGERGRRAAAGGR